MREVNRARLCEQGIGAALPNVIACDGGRAARLPAQNEPTGTSAFLKMPENARICPDLRAPEATWKNEPTGTFLLVTPGPVNV